MSKIEKRFTRDVFRQNEENLDNRKKISVLERKIVSEFHNKITEDIKLHKYLLKLKRKINYGR